MKQCAVNEKADGWLLVRTCGKKRQAIFMPARASPYLDQEDEGCKRLNTKKAKQKKRDGHMLGMALTHATRLQHATTPPGNIGRERTQRADTQQVYMV